MVGRLNSQCARLPAHGADVLMHARRGPIGLEIMTVPQLRVTLCITE